MKRLFAFFICVLSSLTIVGQVHPDIKGLSDEKKSIIDDFSIYGMRLTQVYSDDSVVNHVTSGEYVRIGSGIHRKNIYFDNLEYNNICWDDGRFSLTTSGHLWKVVLTKMFSSSSDAKNVFDRFDKEFQRNYHFVENMTLEPLIYSTYTDPSGADEGTGSITISKYENMIRIEYSVIEIEYILHKDYLTAVDNAKNGAYEKVLKENGSSVEEFLRIIDREAW